MVLWRKAPPQPFRSTSMTLLHEKLFKENRRSRFRKISKNRKSLHLPKPYFGFICRPISEMSKLEFLQFFLLVLRILDGQT